MATRTEATRSSTVGTPTPWMTRFKQGLPWIAFGIWSLGFVGIWYVGSSQNWSPALYITACVGWLSVAAVAARDAVQKTFGPVFLYEIVRLGRKRNTFIFRTLYVVAVLVVLGIQYFVMLEDISNNQDISSVRIPAGRLAQFATEFFVSFSIIQFCVVTFLTPAYVAGCIADEKERKTLEFLLATDLRGHEIIFGKLAARVFNMLMYIMAGLPIMAFMQLFGGIDIDLLIASTALTAVTVVGVAAVSIYFSTTLKKPRDAIAMTYLLLAVYGIGTAVLAIGMQILSVQTFAPIYFFNYQIDTQAIISWLNDAVDWLTCGNVLVVIPMQLRTGLFGGFTGAGLITAIFRYSVFWSIISVVTLGYSTLRLRSIALHQFYGEPRTIKKKIRERKRPEIGNDPMFWKEVFAETPGRSGCAGMAAAIMILVLVFSIPMIIFVSFFGEYIPVVNYIFDMTPRSQPLNSLMREFRQAINIWMRMSTGIIGALLLISVTIRGSGAVSGERDRDTWISLISTPLEAWEMVRAKWYGCVLGVRRGYYVILLIWGLALICGAVEPIMLVVTAIHFAIYISAFAWLGILCSINSRTTMIASIRALLISLFIGGGHWLFLLLCCVYPLSIMSRGMGMDGIESIFVLLGAGTPPFMLGWLPLYDFSTSQVNMFEFHERRNVFGMFAPVIGIVVWVIIGRILAALSWYDFRLISNRDEDSLGSRLQEMKDQLTSHPKTRDTQ